MASRPLSVRKLIPALLSVLLIASATASEALSEYPSGNEEDARSVLRHLFLKHGYEYTIAPDVQGLVDRSVLLKPFKVALHSILDQVGGAFRMESGIYIVERDWHRSRLMGQYGRRQYITLRAETEPYYDILRRVRSRTWQPRYYRQSYGSAFLPLDSVGATMAFLPNPRLTFSLNKRPISDIGGYYRREVADQGSSRASSGSSDRFVNSFRHLPVHSLRIENLQIRVALRQLLTPFDIRFRVSPEIQGSVSISRESSTVLDSLEAILYQLDVAYSLEGDIIFVFPKRAAN